MEKIVREQRRKWNADSSYKKLKMYDTQKKNGKASITCLAMALVLMIVRLLSEVALALEISVPNVSIKFAGGTAVHIDDIIYKYKNMWIIFTQTLIS
jgi:hypothetical protein